jgi:hypothetical protein
MSLQREDVLSGTAECISCRQPAAKLLEISQLAPVDYYRCNGCRHVWVTHKGTTFVVEHLSVHYTPRQVPGIEPTV